MAGVFHRRSVLTGFAGALVLTLSVAFGLSAVADTVVDKTELVITTSSGKRAFKVELALNDRDRAKGLMFRRELADDHGMLFDFESERSIAMWMKNTYIPLDMIFIRSDGTIADIARNTTPLSETVIEPREPVRYVLEVAAGVTNRMGIARNDTVQHPTIHR